MKIKTDIKYREKGNYTKEEIIEFMERIDIEKGFNEVFVRFLFQEPAGNFKYIYAVEDYGKVTLTDSEIMFGNTEWRNSSQIIFKVEGNSGNIDLFSQYGGELEYEEENEEYIHDGKRMTYNEVIEDCIEKGQYYDWKQEIIEESSPKEGDEE